MKRKTIWSIAIVMVISFACLIATQVKYLDDMVVARQEQFDEHIGYVLFAAQRSVEVEETMAKIEQEIETYDTIHRRQAHNEFMALQDSINKLEKANPELRKSLTIFRPSANREERRERLQQRFLHQKDLLSRVIYSVLYKPVDRPAKDRVDFAELDQFILSSLQRHGIDLKYHFRVTTVNGDEIYRCADWEDPNGAKVYRQTLYPNDPPSCQAVINIHFPHMGRYLYAGARFAFPTLVFTFILLAVFIFTIWSIYRSKRLTEMKNDFVNNMTHELKTPISTISLAAQMLSDPVISKNEASLQRFARVISDETKRLRFLVDKVLQTSLFEKGKAATFKMDELDVNTLIEEVASTFTVKVHNVGGEIETQLEAEDPIIFADQMHFTNVVFNLLDNAYKYRRPDSEAKLQLNIRTVNEGETLKIYISDNGIGIKHDQLKNIFKRFYRVHTGDVHNVKGFGLGLAYVASVIEAHKGKIHAESKLGEGTTFVITMPLMG